MKRIFSMLAAAALAVSLCAASARGEAPSDWAAAEVAEAVALGLVPSGLQADYTAAVTREEFCDALLPLARKIDAAAVDAASPEVFADTESQSAASLAGMGIVTGVGGGAFQPDGLVTRQEAAVMLARAGETLGGSKLSVNAAFADSESIADWAAEGVAYVNAAKVMNGTEAGFDPLGGYTREQTFVTILRLYTFLTADAEAEQPKLKDEDLDVAWDDSAIPLQFDGKTAVIAAAGTYVVSGSIPDGQIVVDADNDALVRLVLNGVSLTNTDGAAIYAKACDKLVLILADGTQNALTDGGAAFVYADAENEEPNAAVWAKNDLTVNGTGGLTVNAGFNNGIGTKDDLLVVNGDITVNAVKHALKSKDTATVLGGNINLSTAEGDGVQTDNAEENGNIFIRGGALTLAVADDGIHADNVLEISGGTILVTKAYEGLEGAVVNISGGEIDITATDDGINAAGGSGNGGRAGMGGAFTPEGGNFQIPEGGAPGERPAWNGEAPPEGFTRGERPEGNGEALPGGMRGGGMHGEAPARNGETMPAPPEGQPFQGQGGMPAADQFAARGAYSINISGGDIKIHAGRDALDANGTLNISGGVILAVSDAHNGGDAALDSDGDTTVTGGTLVYDGSNASGRFGAGSTQSYLYSATAIKAGDEIAVSRNGKEILRFTAEINMAGLGVSAPDVASGESYDVSVNGAASAVIAGTGGVSMGGFGGGRGGIGGANGGGRPQGQRAGGNRAPQDGTFPAQ